MLPIRMIDFTDQQDVCAHKEMIKLVCAMLNLNERLLSTESVATTNIVQRQIAATETKIDGLVYMLYSLTKKEIAIVEDHNP